MHRGSHHPRLWFVKRAGVGSALAASDWASCGGGNERRVQMTFLDDDDELLLAALLALHSLFVVVF